MPQRLLVLSEILFLCYALLCPATTTASADPVSDFIQRADSLAQAGGDDLLLPYVVDHSILVGAVVARVLDEGVSAGDEGNKEGEKENLEFAERIARLHQTHNGSNVPLELVETFKSWTPAQRARRKQAKTLEAEAIQARDTGDNDKSLELYLQAMDLFQEIGDRYSVAVTWGSLGIVYWYRGEMDAVKESYDKALIARRAIENSILEAKTLIGLGGANIMTGGYETAIDFCKQAIDLCRRTEDLTYLGTALNYLGTSYYRMGNLIKARDAYEEALPVLEESGNQPRMIEILINIAGYYADMGRSQGANDAYRRAIDIAMAVKQPQDEAAARMNLAESYRLEGRHGEAFDQLEVTEGLLENINDPIKKADFYRIRGFTYMDVGELDRARDDLLACVEECEPLEDPFHQIQALISLGRLYVELEAYENGLSVAEKARVLAEESERTRLVRDATVLAADVLFALARYDEALRLCEDALEMDRESGAEALLLEENLRIANIHAATGNTTEARSVYRESLATSRASGIDLERMLHMNIGHTYEKENPDSAIYYYERALDIVEERRTALGGAGTGTGFLSGKRRFLYEEVARFYASLDEPGNAGEGSARAFYTIERAKARGLMDLLEAAAVREIDPVEEALLDSLYQIANDSHEEKKERRHLERRYTERREARLAESLGSLSSRDAIVGLKDVQKTLPKGTVLLEYALGDTASLLWTIDRKEHELSELPNRRAIGAQVALLRDAIARPGAGDAALRKTARSLYETLVLPAEHRIEKAKRIVIVPDGVLFELPFEVLISKEPGESAEWKDVSFLARSTPTVYAPSASVYVKLLGSEKRNKYPIELLAVGDPDFSLHDDATVRTGIELAPLPYTRSEIEAISSRVKDDKKAVLLGREASERKLKQKLRQQNPRILHLATHGIVDPADPAASCIVVCPDPDAGEDGYLHTLEILNLPLDVGLVVASACESARGSVGRGEGVVGLSRAFVASGAQAIVASLWAVSDKSTSELMTNFYEWMLGKKKPASTALKEARLALMDDPTYAHPFYWSPFVVIGSDRSPW